MRIIQLTPGTGSFYCGTCMRDNALVLGLRKLGEDALMVPMYLEPALDEASGADGAPLFYGGINVYLQQVSGIFRRTPRWVDQVFDSPAMLRAAAKRAGMTQASELGELTVSTLKGEDGRQAKELDRLVNWLKTERVDVVCISNALLIGLARRIKAETGATVVCTLQGEDGFLDSLPEPARTAAWSTVSERAKDVDALIAVSRYHSDLMTQRARLSPEKVHVVHNGISLDDYPESRKPPEEPVIGYLARLHPSKGLTSLVDAFILLKKRVPGAKLKIGGAQTEGDVRFVKDVMQRLRQAGVGDDVDIRPNLSRADKIAFLQSLSVLSVPATYGESFGLYVVEALAAGVPFVQPRHAVFPELLKATKGGILYEADDTDALAEALEEMLLNPTRASQLGETGRKAVRERFTEEQMARGVRDVFKKVASGTRV